MEERKSEKGVNRKRYVLATRKYAEKRCYIVIKKITTLFLFIYAYIVEIFFFYE